VFFGGGGPVLSNRHRLTEAFQNVGKSKGIKLLFNGTYGELTVTAKFGRRHPVIRLLSALRQKLRPSSNAAPPQTHTNPFHVRLAAHRITSLPAEIDAVLSAGSQDSNRPVNEPFVGYLPGISKAFDLPNEFHPGAIRMDYPYRDLRLLRLIASFPRAMLVKHAADRGIARNILKDRIPDAVRMRRHGMPASPDHVPQLQAQASAARARIPHFRKHEVDDWLDLDWLDENLGRISQHGPSNVSDANETQLTAIAAEFLTWWRSTF